MKWNCEWGDREEFLYKVWVDQGIKPAALERKPDLPYYLSIYVKAFSLLTTRRSAGFSGAGPIPLTDILAYAKVIRPHDLERFVILLVVMDNEFMKFIRSKEAPKNGGLNTTSNR